MEDKNKSLEEIDLAQLLLLVSNSFKKAKNSLIRLLKFAFNKIIHFCIFIQVHFLKFVISGIVGLVIGFALDINKPEVYRSSMTVEPNLGSTRQLYSNIEMYDELIRAEDTIELARIFDISPKDAASLKEFSVKALVTKNRMLSTYDNYISTLDSSARNIISFKSYIEDFDPIDAKTHSITVDAENDKVVKQLENTIISYISNNPYYKLKKETTDINIDGSKRILETQLKDIDTLKRIYREVIINQSKPASGAGGTSITFSDKEVKTKEFELLKETRDISGEVEALNIAKIENKNIVNVISNFPERGVKYYNWINRYAVLLPLVAIIVTFFILCLIKFNRFLRKYEAVSNQNQGE